MSERDTHFATFARLLLQELDDAIGENTERMQRGIISSEQEFAQELGHVIARRAYDLAMHVKNIAPVTEWEWDMRDIPDMTAWPEQREVLQ